MFSEYASRFLAQSQSRISFAPSEERRSGPDRFSRKQSSNTWRPSTASRAQSKTAGTSNRPTASQNSGFPFASRPNLQQAPLFYSATDEFREENDEEEHEREIADYYALQKSRRHLGGSDLKESSEAEAESSPSLDANASHQHAGFGRSGGIRSSWRGGVTSGRRRGQDTVGFQDANVEENRSETASDGAGNMVDVGLGDTLRSEPDDDPPDDLIDDPPSIQHLRKAPRTTADESFDSTTHEQYASRGLLLEDSISSELPVDALPRIIQPSTSPPRHDAFWGHVYLLSFAAMCATWFLVYLHTEAPGTKQPLGDTVYTTLHASFHLLAVYTLVAILVSLLWIAALRSYVRHLVYSILLAVPIILYSFSLYPLISSYQGSWHGGSAQAKIIRWSAAFPAILATLWVLAVIRGRLAMQKAISILEFATRILAANPALLVVGFAVLGSIVGFTWIWLSMFTRVFLGGHLSTGSSIARFIIDASTWWLGVYFILVYLWTVAMIFGMQRSVTSATVSQWYFHRLVVPAPSSQTIVKAAFGHSATTLIGTIALSTGLSLLVRLPLLLFPQRFTMLLGVAMYSLIPTPIAILINPLTLTYAAIHSQPLAISARGLLQMHRLTPTDAATSLHPNTFSAPQRGDGWSRDATPLLPYRLAKLLLHATRFIMSLALGFGGWVTTARNLRMAGSTGVRGGLYAYVVGLIAGAIGWGILGAMEGVLACITDAVVVCWGSELGSSGNGEVRYCREAGWLFSEDESREGRVSLA